MSKKTLSAQEIAQLRSSPYVAKIKRGMITFTPEFKTMAYERLGGGVPIGNPSNAGSKVRSDPRGQDAK